MIADQIALKAKRKLARGTAYNLVAYAVYGCATFAIHVTLARLLKANNYGIFGAVFALLAIGTLIVFSGIPKAVAKNIAGNITQAPSILKSGLRVQFVLCLCVFTFFFVGARWLATDILGDPGLAGFIRLASLSIIPLGLLYVYREMFNGIRDFVKSPLTICVTSTFRLLAIVFLVLIGLGLQGAIVGHVVAAVFGLTLAWWLCELPRTNQFYHFRPLLTFAIPLVLYHGAVGLLLNIDTVLVKRIIGDNVQVGHYTAAAAIAHGVFTLFTAFAIPLLPSVAKAEATNDSELTKKYISQVTRYIFLFGLPLVALIGAKGETLVSFFFGMDYVQAAMPLKVLVVGCLFLAVSYNIGIAISGAGHVRIPMMCALLTVPLCLLLSVWLIMRYGLVGAALGVATVCCLQFVILFVYSYRSFDIAIPWGSFCRISVAASTIYGVAKLYSASGAMLPLAYYPLLGCLYMSIILLLGESTEEDREVIKALLAYRGSSIHVTQKG